MNMVFKFILGMIVSFICFCLMAIIGYCLLMMHVPSINAIMLILKWVGVLSIFCGMHMVVYDDQL